MEKQNSNPVSFTDTNADTGAGGGGTSMMTLMAQMKKKKDKEEKSSRSDRSTNKKKKKKGKKGKTKNVRQQDRYESQNFLFRIEGVLWYAGMVCLAIVVIAWVLIFLICGIYSRFQPISVFNCKDSFFCKVK